jgi:hypothetical protein
MMEHRMGDVLNLEPIKSRLEPNQSYLVYFLPTNYVMQGLIADTGDDWQLYKGAMRSAGSRIGSFIPLPTWEAPMLRLSNRVTIPITWRPKAQ